MNNHDGTFREEGLIRGVALSEDGQDQGRHGRRHRRLTISMAHIDWSRRTLSKTPTAFIAMTAKANFEDVTASGALGGETRFISWGTGIVDLDNDGYPDIFIVAGTCCPELEKIYAKYPDKKSAMIFRNLGNGTFEELGDEAGPAIARAAFSRGCAFGDFDNDGDLDIVDRESERAADRCCATMSGGKSLAESPTEGTKSNRSAIGARVIVRYGGKCRHRCLEANRVFFRRTIRVCISAWERQRKPR